MLPDNNQVVPPLGFLLGLSLLSGVGTLLGALLALHLPLRKAIPYLIGAAAGVMSTVVLLELIPISLHLGGLIQMITGSAAGIFLCVAADMLLGPPPVNLGASYQRLGWFLLTGIALHDFPEGIAIGAGGTVTMELGIFLAAAVGIHNVPEGLINAAPLRLGGLGKKEVLRLNALLSLVTPTGTVAGLAVARFIPLLIPALLAVAAGAMLYIVLKELTPRMMRKKGAVGFVCGTLLMTVLFWFVHQ
ncbi:MAG: ZIP family metal transporter [Ammonifex sp.]|jgi:ZIP family zinc transporter|nr:MAG: ZIP family metal transporter [Ammonifex sp.]